MSIDINILMMIIWIHFVSDFILQSDKMAHTKSSSNLWLSIHIVVYSIPLIILGPLYALINGLAHWITDWFSSRATSWLYKRELNHWFFVVIGLDQAIHITTLVLTFPIYGAPLL